MSDLNVRAGEQRVHELSALVVGRASIGVIEVARVLNGDFITLFGIIGAIAVAEKRACDSHTADRRSLSLKS